MKSRDGGPNGFNTAQAVREARRMRKDEDTPWPQKAAYALPVHQRSVERYIGEPISQVVDRSTLRIYSGITTIANSY